MKLKNLLLMMTLMLLVGSTFGQTNRPTHELHAMMIYNFLKYVQWPGDLNNGEFVIGVMGDSEVYNTLNTWYGNKEKGGKKLIVKQLDGASEASSCQLVYVGAKASGDFDAIINNISGKPVLTVSGKNGLGKRGSCINFKVVNNRLKFELNQSAVAQSNLKISSQLSAMAIMI